MNKNTQYVLDDARSHNPRNVPDIQADASSALTSYVFLKSGLAYRALSDSSWDTAELTVLRLVEGAWLDVRARKHIREMAALNRLCTALAETGRDWRNVIVEVGDDLNASRNWPEVNDADRLFNVTSPFVAPADVATPEVTRGWSWRSLTKNQINPNQITSNPFWNSWKNPGVR